MSIHITKNQDLNRPVSRVGRNGGVKERAPDKNRRLMKILLGLLVVFVVLDGLLTRFLVDGGLAREGNPFLESIVGEDAFIALIEGMGPEQAHRRAGTLLRQIENKPIVNPSGRRLKVDYEVRFATYPQDATSLWTLLEAVQRRAAASAESDFPASDRKILMFSSRS